VVDTAVSKKDVKYPDSKIDKRLQVRYLTSYYR